MKILPLLLLPLLLFSCKPNAKAPADLIDKKIMEKVLLDVNIAESYSAMVKDSLHRIGTKNPDSLSAYYKDIFTHYKISSDQFNASLNWYKAHPADLDTMFNNIIPLVQKWPVKPAPALPAPANIKVDKR